MENQSQSIHQKWARRFFTVWTGQAFSLFGSALVQFALIWWLTQKSGSATVLAIATLAGMLPMILLGPFAGALVDRWNRRVIMIVADATIAVFTLLLAYLFATDAVQVWHVYVILAARALGSAFHFPAMSASTPLMVPEDQLTRVNGLNQTLQGINGLLAPPIGAILIGLLPTQGILLIDVGTAMLAILPLFFISIPQPKRHEDLQQKEKPSLMQDIREALTYIRSWPGLVAIIFMALFLNFLLVPTGALLPILVTKHFNKGALELGLINSAEGIGIIAGGILLSIWGGFKKKIVTSMIGIIGLGIGVMLIGLAPSSLFMVAIIGCILLGVMIPITNGPIGALLQSIIRPDIQGRVMSLLGSAATAISPLGILIAGPLSDALGIQVWFWAGGLICLLIGIAGFFIPTVMDIENNRETTIQPAVSD
ncbi:MAG: MFS transporter [Anaerolineae bacterium]|nr:MFS transporter [Anaerolineae bacterium]MCI0608574.1 MFS transporter [Anaerolineae bacterium]